MTSKSGSISMKGDGYYDAHSQVQSVVINTLVPLLEDIVSSIPKPASGQSCCIVDYGCSEGKNSIAVVRSAIESVRKLRPDETFFVVHEDLPSNNFNRLFSQIYDQDRADASAYGATSESPVYVFAAGGTFYARVMPARSVHLGLSSSSVHWTSSAPRISAHIFHADASVSENSEYALLAARDWLNFLKLRSAELVAGGNLLVTLAARVTLSADGANDAAGPVHESHSARRMFQLLFEILTKLVAEKKIDSDALESFAFPIYCRSQSELVEPVVSGELKEELRVEYVRIESIPCPLHARFKEDGDADKYADGLTGIVRAFTEPIVRNNLFAIKERRKSALESTESQNVIESIYEQMKAEIARAPDNYTFYPCHATIVFSKLQ